MISVFIEINNFLKTDLAEYIKLNKQLISLENQLKKSNFISALDLLNNIKKFASLKYPNLLTQINSLSDILNKKVREIKIGFNSKFIDECHGKGLVPVSGDYIKGFKIKGLIDVIVNFDKNEVTIGTNCKSEKLKINMKDIINVLIVVNNRLFNRKINISQFSDKLLKAYLKASNGKFNQEVLLKDVQINLWKDSQSELFWKTLDKNKFKEYPTDEFSVDISKLISARPPSNTEFVFSEGAGGITVYDSSGNFKSFKFISFNKRSSI